MIRDANQKAAAAEATNIFQNHYPEFLVRSSLQYATRTSVYWNHPQQTKKFFVNVPTLLTWVFWLFKPLISAKTLAKFTVVGTGKATIGKELLPFIPADQLPKKYGGEAEDLAWKLDVVRWIFPHVGMTQLSCLFVFFFSSHLSLNHSEYSFALIVSFFSGF